MKILITGATGFLGRHLVYGLLEEGYSVVILKPSLECLQDININNIL